MRLAQLDRAFGYGPKGRGFESSSARCKKKGRCEKHLPFLFRSDAEDTTPGSYLRFAPVGAKSRSTEPCAFSSARFCFESRKPLFIKASGFFHALRIRLVLWSTVVHLYRAHFKSELTGTGSLPIDFDHCRDFYAIKGAYYAIRTKTCYRIFSPNMIK